MSRDDKSIGAGTFGGASDSAHVTHIGDMVEEDKERHMVVIVEEMLRQGLEMLIGDSGDACHHALMVAVDKAVEFLDRDILDRDMSSLDSSTQLRDYLTDKTLLHKHLIELGTRREGLEDRAKTID